MVFATDFSLARTVLHSLSPQRYNQNSPPYQNSLDINRESTYSIGVFLYIKYIDTSVVVMVVVNCNYAVMDYLLYLIVSNLG